MGRRSLRLRPVRKTSDGVRKAALLSGVCVIAMDVYGDRSDGSIVRKSCEHCRSCAVWRVLMSRRLTALRWGNGGLAGSKMISWGIAMGSVVWKNGPMCFLNRESQGMMESCHDENSVVMYSGSGIPGRSFAGIVGRPIWGTPINE